MNTADTPAIAATFMNEGMSYVAYRELIDRLLEEGLSTGPNQSEALTEYSKLNVVRMNRIDRTLQLLPEALEALNMEQRPLLWGVLTEGWCGDAAQNVPVLAALAAASPAIELRLLLRDNYLPIMDCYLTNGGRSIPKLICFDAETGTELFTWGPRPAELQQMVLEMKANPGLQMKQVIEEVQRWYAQDRTRSMQHELAALLRQIL